MSRGLNNKKIMFRNYPDVVDVNDMSLMLGISKKLAYRLVSQGQIGSVKIGRSYKIPKAFIVQYLVGNDHAGI
jgi:excisionase family DNA binding protein